MKRDSFIFYRSFFEAGKDLPNDERLAFYDAVASYALDSESVETSGIVAALFKLVQPQIDKNNQRFENGCKGGRKKETKTKPNENQNKTKPKPKQNQSASNRKPNVNVNDNVNVNVNDNDNSNANQNVNVNQNARRTAAATWADI